MKLFHRKPTSHKIPYPKGSVGFTPLQAKEQIQILKSTPFPRHYPNGPNGTKCKLFKLQSQTPFTVSI